MNNHNKHISVKGNFLYLYRADWISAFVSSSPTTAGVCAQKKQRKLQFS